PLSTTAVFVLFNTVILCLQMAISVCERESWGARLARDTPRNPLLRALAFLIYTGSAGGILFTLLLMGLTMGLALYWEKNYVSTTGAREELEAILAGAGGAMLYTTCYCLTGLLVRHYLMGDLIRPGYTWLVAALMLGVATCVPAIIAMAFFDD